MFTEKLTYEPQSTFVLLNNKGRDSNLVDEEGSERIAPLTVVRVESITCWQVLGEVIWVFVEGNRSPVSVPISEENVAALTEACYGSAGLPKRGSDEPEGEAL